MLTFIALNSIVILSAYFLGCILQPTRKLADFILICFIIFLSQITLVNLFLGTLSLLYLQNIIISHAAIFLAVYALFKRFGKAQKFNPDFSFILGSKRLIFAISIFLGFLIVKTWINLNEPPNIPDSWQYHLSFPATWIRNGNINNPLVPCGPKDYLVNFLAMTYYPMSSEFYFHWLMAPLRNAFVADIGQVPFYLFGILAIYSILRKFGVARERALLLAFSWALIPNIFKQLEYAALVDVICAASMLFVLNMILFLKKEESLSTYAIFGLALGLFISSKALNLFWAVSLFPLFFYDFFLKKTPHRLKALFIIAFFALAIGGYSYIKNLIMTGNAFYPVTFKLFGRVIMPGIVDRQVLANLLFPWKEFKIKDLLFSEGLGVQLFSFVIPGTFIIPPFLYFFKERFKEEGALRIALLLLIPLIMVLEYFFYIKAFWTRYFFPFYGMGIIAFGIFAEKFNWGRKYTGILATVCVLSSAAEFSGHAELVISLVLSAAIFLFIYNFRRITAFLSEKGFLRPIYAILILLFVLGLFALNAQYDRNEADRYAVLFRGRESVEGDIGRLWQWVHNNSAQGKRIAYTGRGEFYPLFGPKLVNDVFYVSVNDKPPVAHYYPGGEHRRELSQKSWLKNIRSNAVDMLVVYLPHEENKFPIEDEWAAKNPDKFRLVYKNSKAKVYSVKMP
ncbi:MAG: hypothetical protein AB1481_02500 [Candidatus Omnitrophota bacterium]